MDRRTAESVLLAALAVAALAAAAATLPSATTSGGGSGTGLPGGSAGQGGPLITPASDEGTTLDVPFLRPVLAALFVIAAVLLVVYAFLYRREAFRALLGVVAVAAVLALLLWLLSRQDLFGAGGAGPAGFPFGDQSGPEGDGTPASPPLLVFALLAVVALGAVAVLLRSGSAFADDAGDDDGPGAEEVAAVGRAAGRAAERIEAAGDLDNEVYRAWREMTGLLEVERPEATSPGEFAAAATGAGMDPDDVGELTRLFEDVRYGGEEPTEGMERRALSILRRVEETYAPGEDDGG